MNKIAVILAWCLGLVACTVNYITGSDNDVSMSEHRGLIVTPDEDDSETDPDTENSGS